MYMRVTVISLHMCTQRIHTQRIHTQHQDALRSLDLSCIFRPYWQAASTYTFSTHHQQPHTCLTRTRTLLPRWHRCVQPASRLASSTAASPPVAGASGCTQVVCPGGCHRRLLASRTALQPATQPAARLVHLLLSGGCCNGAAKPQQQQAGAQDVAEQIHKAERCGIARAARAHMALLAANAGPGPCTHMCAHTLQQFRTADGLEPCTGCCCCRAQLTPAYTVAGCTPAGAGVAAAAAVFH
jgi:hypothetical protein